jgi:cyclohexanecarboxyl-CoA dehydrogenase
MTNPFLFTEEHEEFRLSVRGLAQSRFAGTYLEKAKSDKYPLDELRQLGEAGITGLLIDVEDGGQGADALTLGIAIEEVSHANLTIGYVVFGSTVAAHVVAQHAKVDAKGKWLPGLLSGEAVAALALTEPESGSDAAAMRTTATQVDGGWILNGEKTSITAVVHAHLIIVFAKTDPSAGARGVTAFLVDANDPTVSTHPFDDPGNKPLGRGSVVFDGTFVPDDHMLGTPGNGFRIVMHEFDLTRSLIGLILTGGAQKALDLTAEYVTQRQAFGQPISRNQGVSFPIAEHTTYVEALRMLSYRSLGLRVAGRPHSREAAMVKWWGPEVAFNAIKDCMVLHGHIAYSDDLPFQSMLRDVSAYFIGDGTPQIQKLVIARDVLGRDAVGS